MEKSMNRESPSSMPGPCTFSTMTSRYPCACCAMQPRSSTRCGNSSSERQISCLYATFRFTLATSAGHPTKERGFTMNRIEAILTITLVATLPAFGQAMTNKLIVKAVNTLETARPSQTIELSAQQLAPLGEKDLRKIHVKNAAGKELLCQAVDTDGDYHPDEVIFQADFVAGETNSFTVTVGKKWDYTKDQFKAYGRFVRERFDDFAWENDRIAHRTYGKALETWKEEPLTSSAIDVWVKRVPYLVINGWYMLENYHLDHGEGADFYSAGTTRGNGGDGLWAADKLWVSKNFVNSRVLACGPIRVLFELTYEPFEANGTKVSEVRRIALDDG